MEHLPDLRGTLDPEALCPDLSSDEDDQGNLAGFVVEDGHVSMDSDAVLDGDCGGDDGVDGMVGDDEGPHTVTKKKRSGRGSSKHITGKKQSGGAGRRLRRVADEEDSDQWHNSDSGNGDKIVATEITAHINQNKSTDEKIEKDKKSKKSKKSNKKKKKKTCRESVDKDSRTVEASVVRVSGTSINVNTDKKCASMTTTSKKRKRAAEI